MPYSESHKLLRNFWTILELWSLFPQSHFSIMLKTLAITAVFLAITQARVPIAGQTSNNDRNDGHRNQNETGARQAQAPIAPGVIKPADAGRPEPEPYKGSATKKQDSVTIVDAPGKRDAFDHITLAVGIILAMITGFGVIAAFRGLPELKRQAEAARDAAIAAKDAVDLSRDTTKRQLRAYVGVHQVGVMGIYEDGILGVGFAFVNYGQTPALRFNIRGQADLLPYPLPDSYVMPEPPERPRQDGVIFPHQNNPMTGWVWETGTRLSAKDKMDLFSKTTERELYAHGIATYVDVFDEKRSTEFCFVINPHSVVRNPAGDILHDREGRIQFQFAPVANRNFVR
jgi:hypothetical protein